MLKKPRCTYQELKNQALEIYYDFCRDHLLDRNVSHADILAKVDYHFDETFNYPLEELMFCVLELVLSGGWHQSVEEFCRAWISDWKSKNDLQKMLNEIPKEEAELFLNDLGVLKLI